MQIKSEAEMIECGKNLAEKILAAPDFAKTGAVIELRGDVGAGKTTLTRGLAEGLGVKTAVTSPSFTISKTYGFLRDGTAGQLIHYDFYRLPEPGLMAEDLDENIGRPNTVVVVEWAETVEEILPSDRWQVEIKYNDDGTRAVKIN